MMTPHITPVQVGWLSLLTWSSEIYVPARPYFSWEALQAGLPVLMRFLRIDNLTYNLSQSTINCGKAEC